MPTTRRPWPSTRATKHTTLLVPISRAEMIPFLVLATMSPVLTLLNWSVRRCIPTGTFSEIELVRQPHVDDSKFARQKLVRLFELGGALQRRDGVLLGQPDLGVVAEH